MQRKYNTLIKILFVMTLLVSNVALARRVINIQQSVGSLLTKVLDLKFDFKIQESTTVGVIYMYHGWRSSAISNTHVVVSPDGGYSFGARLNYMFKDRNILGHSGWYIDPYIIFHRYKLLSVYDFISYAEVVSKNYTEYGGLIGYQWFASNGLNAKFALGIRHDSEPILFKKDDVSDSIQTRPTAQFTIGFAF